MFSAANLRLLFSTQTMVIPQLNDNLPGPMSCMSIREYALQRSPILGRNDHTVLLV